MICGLWFYHLTFCHVNPFLLYPPSAATEFEAIFHLSGGTLKSFPPFTLLPCWCLALSWTSRASRDGFGASRPLVLTEAIATPAVQGRFDHFGFDGKKPVVCGRPWEHTVEVIDISARLRSHTITGIFRILKAWFTRRTRRKLFAGQQQGKCEFMAVKISIW